VDHSKFWLWNPPNVNWSGMPLIFYALNIRKLAINPETKIHNQKDRNPEISRHIGKNQLFQKTSPSTSHGFSFHPWCPTQYLDLCRGHRVEPGLNEAIQPGFHRNPGIKWVISMGFHHWKWWLCIFSGIYNTYWKWWFTGDFLYFMVLILWDSWIETYWRWWSYGTYNTYWEWWFNGIFSGMECGGWGWNGITKWDNYWDWFQASMVGYN